MESLFSPQPESALSMPATAFGEWLKVARRRRGWSQRRLGEVVDLSKAQISRLEGGVQSTKNDTAVRIARALGVNPREALDALATDTLDGEGTERIPDEEQATVDAYLGIPPEIRGPLKAAILAAAAESHRQRQEAQQKIIPGTSSANEPKNTSQ